jgi:hypothetical protein
MTPAERRQVLEASLVSMAAIYGADHPDVVRAKRELTALQGESAGAPAPGQLADDLAGAEQELANARLQYSEDHPDVQALERKVAELRTATQAADTTTDVTQLPRSDNAYVQLYGQLRRPTPTASRWPRRRRISKRNPPSSNAWKTRRASRASTAVSCANTTRPAPSIRRSRASSPRRSSPNHSKPGARASASR